MKFEILPGLPPYGPLATAFDPGGGPLFSEGLVVKFFPDGQPPWVGNFARGIGSVEGVYDHPNKIHILVVASGLVYIIDPVTRSLLSTHGDDFVYGLLRNENIVFANTIMFYSYGINERTWVSRRISWDGFRNIIHEDPWLHGEAWEPSELWSTFSLNLDTGRVVGGSYNGPPM